MKKKIKSTETKIMSSNGVSPNTPLRNIKKVLPDIETILLKNGHAPLVRMITTMANAEKLPISNIARAAGYTELEINLLTQSLNEKLDYFPPPKRVKIKKKEKPVEKVKTKENKSVKKTGKTSKKK